MADQVHGVFPFHHCRGWDDDGNGVLRTLSVNNQDLDENKIVQYGPPAPHQQPSTVLLIIPGIYVGRRTSMVAAATLSYLSTYLQYNKQH